MLKTHMPVSFFERGLQQQPKAKVVVGARSPKDTLVSLYNFYRVLGPLGNFPGTWDEFFELYKNKRVFYCDFFEYYEGWWRYKNENPDQVLFVRYEDMKRDVSGVIRKLAAFLDKSLTDEQVERIKVNISINII